MSHRELLSPAPSITSASSSAPARCHLKSSKEAVTGPQLGLALFDPQEPPKLLLRC